MYIIDGYNLVHALHRHEDIAEETFSSARTVMLELISIWTQRKNEFSTIYFDGSSGRGGSDFVASPHCRVVFCHGDADEAICDTVNNVRAGEKVTVVTSDREIARHCRAEGAIIRSSESVASELLSISAKNDPQISNSNEAALSNEALLSIGEMEQEMIESVGDFQKLAREAISEPLPGTKPKRGNKPKSP